MPLLSEGKQNKKMKRRSFWMHNKCNKRMNHGENHSLYIRTYYKMRKKFFSIFGCLMESLRLS
jgi:hypothetical protein